MTDRPLVVFTPSGRRGRFPRGTPLLQAARELGVDIDSVCGGRALCGRCQITLSEGEFAKHGISSRADAHLAAGPDRGALSGAQPEDGAGPPPVLSDAAARRRGHRRAARQPGAQAGGQEARRGPRDRARSGGAAALRRGRAARHARADRRPAAPAEGARRAVAPGRADLRSAQPAEPAEGAPPGRLAGHGRGPFGQPHHRGVAGLP